MFSKKSALTKFLSLILAFCFFATPYQARATQGKTGQMLGGLLILAGGFALYKGMSMCNPACTPPAYAWITGGILGMAGGLVAMNQNGQNDKELTPGGPTGGLTAGPSIDINWPKNQDGSPINLPDKCKEFPQLCKCNDSACNQPTLQLPPKDDLEKLMRSGGSGKTVLPDGTTLDDALAKLNDNYDKAKDAANAFNQQSAAGSFLPGGDGGLGGDSSGSGDDYTGLNKGGSGEGSDSASRGGGFDSPSNPFANNSNADLDNLKKMRGEPDPVTTVGLNLQNNNTNKLLNIFERAARVLRGDRNRDISLAKIEWARKEALKKQGKAPSTISAPKQ